MKKEAYKTYLGIRSGYEKDLYITYVKVGSKTEMYTMYYTITTDGSRWQSTWIPELYAQWVRLPSITNFMDLKKLVYNDTIPTRDM